MDTEKQVKQGILHNVFFQGYRGTQKHRLQIEECLRNNNLLVDITKRHKDIVLMKMANKNIKS